MFIKTTTHKRIVAEKDAEIAEKDAEIAGLMKRIGQQAEQNNTLRARLAPFATPKARDSRGRFIKDTVA